MRATSGSATSSMIFCALGFALVAGGCKKDEEPGKAARPRVEPATAGAATRPAVDGPTVGDMSKVGRVDFKVECDPAVQAPFERGVALLHSFFYAEARNAFTEVTGKDPQCAMGHWGLAMTWYHPLWAAPTDDEFKAGKEAILKASTTGKRSERDQLLVDALVAFFAAEALPADAQPTGQSCHGPSGGHPALAAAYSARMKAAHDKFPDDEEVGAFYALSLLGSAPPVDPELKNQKAAAAVLEALWARRKDHPGVPHYLIHAFDYPSLAARGLDAALAYAAIAPSVPHVLHMPSHIFIRLGKWKEAIESNIASAAAARAYAAQKHPDAIGFEELHALDYMVYGYLQTGADESARAISDRIPTIKKSFPEVDFISSYALAAIPARYAVERHDWKAAKELTIADLPGWKKFPFTEATIEYARGLGRARSGDLEGAKQSLARLVELRDGTTDPKFGYFEKHVALQHKAVSAWLSLAEGRKDEAVKLMTEAAAAEDKLGKHPVSPGPIFPIYEQLGELLLEVEQPAPALAAFQAGLKSSPRRFNGLFGAGKAAHAASNDAEARTYWAELIAMADGGSQRPELTVARTFLEAR